MIKALIFKFRFVFIAFIYVLGFVIFRENHPFSRYPMYDSFPNWSYVFYISDRDDNILDQNSSNLKSGELNHFFCTYMGSNNYYYGSGIEKQEELALAGDEMLRLALKEHLNDSQNWVYLHRVYFSFVGDSIHKKDDVISKKFLGKHP